ncbi:MAG TPA: class I SAM-dependent methyltransferase [Thermoanaerobaculia bacterium]|nr:class I SAM-dependent methyltransferase [Thermoanaerobaculia bacterium]
MSGGVRLKSALRRIARATLPRRVRRFLRDAAREIPHRIHDFPADVRDLFADAPLPPARLRRRVSRRSSRAEFEEVGRGAAAGLLEAFRSAREPETTYPRWLDFGCGAGRIARHLLEAPEIAELTGVDVDPLLVAWTERRLRGASFRRIEPAPPLPFPDARFDVVVSVSVFTHFDEEPGRGWAAEVARVLRPGGLFLVSTHGAAIAASQPLPDALRRRFADTGFLFLRGDGRFNDDVAFHSEAYLRSAWAPWFTPVSHVEQGLMGFQDLSVWRKSV